MPQAFPFRMGTDKVVAKYVGLETARIKPDRPGAADFTDTSPVTSRVASGAFESAKIVNL